MTRVLLYGVSMAMVGGGLLLGKTNHNRSEGSFSRQSVSTVTGTFKTVVTPTTTDQTTCQLCHRLCAQHEPLCRRFCRDNEQCGEDPIAYCREQHTQCDQDCTNYECPQEDE